uniref:Uncharacterized protein n=1 Tax=Glossina pallidipes TaxID=7398 RepID=A0A1A9Z1X5_GLOPL
MNFPSSLLTDEDDPEADDEIAEVSDDEGELEAAADDSMLVQQKTLQQHKMRETLGYVSTKRMSLLRSSSSSSSKVLFVQLSSCIAESKASSDFLQLSFDEGLAEERLVPRLEASIIEEVEELSLFLTALPKILYKKITYRSVLLDGPSRIASVGTVLGGYLCSISMASRSTLGSSCIKLYWYKAAVDIFLLDLLRGFMLNPGIEAKTSRIVDACVIAVGSCAAEDTVLVVVFATTAEAAAIAALACCCCIRRLLLPLLDGLQLLAELLAWPIVVLAVSLILLAAIVMVVDFLSGRALLCESSVELRPPEEVSNAKGSFSSSSSNRLIWVVVVPSIFEFISVRLKLPLTTKLWSLGGSPYTFELNLVFKSAFQPYEKISLFTSDNNNRTQLYF